MTADDWSRVTALFEAARLLDPSARAAFLDAVAGSAPDLRQQLDSLLAADAADDDFLSPPTTAVMAAALEHATRAVATGAVLRDRYRIEEQLASGGQALVYRAVDQLLSRPVVIKVMRTPSSQNAPLKARFEQEMRALSRIDHPAVVGILDVGTIDDGSPFLVLQFIDGVSVREILEDGPVDAKRAMRIVQAVAAALRAAHSAGVAHQDLKPENVMLQRLSDGGEAVKLIDFGIAKIDRAGLPPSVTTLTIAGTIRYMAPEQFEGRNEPASDVYALGLLACELLYGQPDLRAVARPIDGRVGRLLSAAVAFGAQDRPKDICAWADELANTVVRPRARHGVMVGAAAAAAALLVAIGGYAALTRNDGADARIIEKVGAFDPVHEGFQIHGSVVGTVIPDPAHTGLVGWSVASREPGGGYYFHPLTRKQKRAALARGWSLTATIQPHEGAAFADVDFAGEGKRFDINVFLEPDAYLIRLGTQIVPTYQGLELRLPRTETRYHRFELRFDPSLQIADLWVDGERRLTGYRGHMQFQDENVGIMFGTTPYRGERGVASFLGVRFEINP